VKTLDRFGLGDGGAWCGHPLEEYYRGAPIPFGSTTLASAGIPRSFLGEFRPQRGAFFGGLISFTRDLVVSDPITHYLQARLPLHDTKREGRWPFQAISW
jgi:hypothetical protein